MTGHIVFESTKNIKSLARQTLEGRWLEALITMLFATLITDLPKLIFGLFDYGSFIGYMLDAYDILIKAPVQLGLAMYFLNVFRAQPGGTQDIKNAFYSFPNALSLYLTIWIRTTLGFFFFVIPGIIAMFKYSMAFFILAENPRRHWRECMLESKFIMEGNKMKLFKLLLSFLPLYILFDIPSTLVNYFSNPGNAQVYMDALNNADPTLMSGLTYNNSYITYIVSLMTLFVQVYLWNSEACFYDLLSENLVVTSNDQI